jgi:hypothetical protein
VVLSLDWIDTAGMLRQAWGAEPIGAKIILVSPDAYSHRSWSMDYQGLLPADVYMMCEPEPVLPLLLSEIRQRTATVSVRKEAAGGQHDALSIRALAEVFNRNAGLCLARGMRGCR